MTESKRHTNREIISFFQSRLPSLGSESALRYRRTISGLDCFFTAHALNIADLSETTTADWAFDLLRQGLSTNTTARHLNILSSLAKSAAKVGLMPLCDAPRALARELEQPSFSIPALLKEGAFDHCLHMLRNIPGNVDSPDVNVYTDLLLFSLLNMAMPIGKAAMLRKADVKRFEGLSRTILERNMTPKRAFVFDLRQSYRTPAQIYSAVAEGLIAHLDGCLPVAGLDPDSFSRSMWAACAIRSGATASEASGCVDGPSPYLLPRFCSPAAISPESRMLLARSVCSMLIQDAPRWYAMRLRAGVRFDDLRREITENVRPLPELFYPCETIRRISGGRTVVEDRPFISGTAFFRTSPECVAPLFHAIGDKAWCYRLSNSPGSPYAIIPQTDMGRFQAAVGVFTPDIEIHPLGELEPRPGESVIIVTAGFRGREGKVEEVVNSGCGSAIFRVCLSTDQGYEWRMDVDARQIERILRG